MSSLIKKSPAPKTLPAKESPTPDTGGVPVPVSDAPWMDWMLSHQGEKEIPGSRHNNFIVRLFTFTSYKAKTDETPWCAATVCAALEESGFKSTRSAAAKSFILYGAPCEFKYGCIVVIRHKSNGGYHVGFGVSKDSRYIKILGGNQANQLKISTFDLRHETLEAVRWPVERS